MAEKVTRMDPPLRRDDVVVIMPLRGPFDHAAWQDVQTRPAPSGPVA
jgi:hypothetical protein